MPDLARCRGCNRLIRWRPTADGKAMPLDPAPDPAGNVVIEGGVARVLSPRHGPLPISTVLYMPHWATCPDAKKFSHDELARAKRRTEKKHGVSLQDGHKCRMEPCVDLIPPWSLLCPRHLSLVPGEIQLALARSYRYGQVEGALAGEIAPSAEWLAAAAAALQACIAAEARQTPERTN